MSLIIIIYIIVFIFISSTFTHLKTKPQSPGRNIFGYLGSQPTRSCSKKLLK